jgi:oxygen-independent coproporphyrinogen-3 oxidase
MNALLPVSAATSALAPLLARHDGRAPRYTSYPTAISFSGEVDEAVYRTWLASLDPGRALSLYLHIPFCERLCWYCGCNTRAVSKAALVSRYVDLLIEEMALLEAALPGAFRAGQIHLGGGTPNLLSRDDLTRLFKALKHVFKVAPGAEIAAELDPATLSREWVQAAAFHGLSRASVGVQDLSPRVQKAVNRIESFEVVQQAVGWLREVGVLSVNLDLMYGLPHQTTNDVLETLDQVLTLAPERIALFGYAHVPWAKPHQKLIPESALPGALERFDQGEAAAARLAAEGYVRIGLDHFARQDDALAASARTGAIRRNFQGYTVDPFEVLLGLGASSIGRLPQGFVQNAPEETQWQAQVRAGHLPVRKGVVLTAEDRFCGAIIERLMCDLTVDLKGICEAHGRSLSDLDSSLSRLAPLQEDGLVQYSGARVTVTDAGRPFLRSACQAFDTRSNSPGAHARIL